MQPHLSLSEDDEFSFDEESADRPCRFIETYCKHFAGRFANQPFILEPVQKQIVRDVFGWCSRETGFRRFSSVWLEMGVGSGKSPLLAALGLYGLIADNEPGAQVLSMASNFSQARVVFDCAKKMIELSEELAEHFRVNQFEIFHDESKSSWRIISGKGPKAGLMPSMVLADEIHEWPSREIYDSVQGRMAKRRQPLMICATNAGSSRNSLCWQLHEEAVAVLEGKSANKTLYPVIFAAPKDADIASPESWKLANPLLGVTVEESKVRDEYNRAKGTPSLEARFRRFYLSQWVQGSSKWLSMDLWDKRTGEIKPADDAPLYIGLDLSLGDDLCALTKVFAGEHYQVDSHFWLPFETAEKYQTQDEIPYLEWSNDGAISLLDESTITPAFRVKLAKIIIDIHKHHRITAVCYDRYKADECIVALEAAGIVCIPIAQGYTVSPGCRELERRLKDGSITIAPNPVLRSCAENVELKGDDRGNVWPVKPNAKGQYAGKREMKIDGITALVTALTEARKHTFAKIKTNWTGNVWILNTNG